MAITISIMATNKNSSPPTIPPIIELDISTPSVIGSTSTTCDIYSSVPSVKGSELNYVIKICEKKIVALEKTRNPNASVIQGFPSKVHLSIYLIEFDRWWILDLGVKTGRYAL